MESKISTVLSLTLTEEIELDKNDLPTEMHRRKAKPKKNIYFVSDSTSLEICYNKETSRTLRNVIKLGMLVNARFTKLQRISCDPLLYLITCEF